MPENCKAEAILGKIQKKVYPNSSRSASLDNLVFSINGDTNLSEKVYNQIIINKSERKDNLNKNVTEGLLSEPYNNLIKDSNLDYFVSKIAEGSLTDIILPSTRFKKSKILINRLIKFHTRLQNNFNQNIVSTVKIIISKFSAFYKQYYQQVTNITNDVTDIKSDINEINTKVTSLEEYKGKITEYNEAIENTMCILDEKVQGYEACEKQIKVFGDVIENKMQELEENANCLKDSESQIKVLYDAIIDKIKEFDNIYKKEMQNYSNWMKQFDSRLNGQESWLSLISKRIEDYEQNFTNLRKELFYEARSFSKNKVGEFTPRIINPSRYANKIIKSNGKTKLQLGAGMDDNDDYINVDIRELSSVDITAEATNLPFVEGSISEIYNAHLIEHFTLLDLKNRVLPYWYKLLEAGGKLRIVTPNIEAMIYQFTNNDIDFNTFAEVVFGGQEYKGNYHYMMFNKQTLSNLLQGAGFEKIEIIQEKRQNGKCIEMEVLAFK